MGTSRPTPAPPVSPLRRLRSVRRLRLVSVAALVLLTTACEVRTRVEVTVDEDGSGTVAVAVGLDREALAQVPDLDGSGTSDVADLAALVRTEDLEAAGWEVVEPDEAGSDTTWIRVTKPFGTPEEANAILAEVTGPDGPLRDLRLSRSTGFASTELTFSGTADLSGGLEAFGDSGLAQALDGEPLGEDAAQIEQRIGQPIAEALRLDVIVDLPGGLDANTDDRAGGAARWSPRLGDGAEQLSATGSVRDRPVQLLMVIAGLLLAAAVVAVARVVLVRPRSRPLPPPSREGEAPPPGPAPGEAERVPVPVGDGGDAEGEATDGERDELGGGDASPEPDIPGWHHPPPVPPEVPGWHHPPPVSPEPAADVPAWPDPASAPSDPQDVPGWRHPPPVSPESAEGDQ